MKKITTLLLAVILVLCFVGCSSNLTNTASGENQSATMLSLDVKVLTAITDKVGTSFSVEALENCDERIIAGDIITVTSDYAEVIDVLDTFQTADCFTIYFPVVNETSDGVSVNCIDAIPQN